MTATEYAQSLIDAPDLKAYRAISNTAQRDDTIDFWDVCLEQIRLDRAAHTKPEAVEAGEFE